MYYNRDYKIFSSIQNARTAASEGAEDLDRSSFCPGGTCGVVLWPCITAALMLPDADANEGKRTKAFPRETDSSSEGCSGNAPCASVRVY